MFAKNRHRNSFVSKFFPRSDYELLDRCIEKTFSGKRAQPYKCEEMAAVKDCEKFNKMRSSYGYGKVGFESQIKNLSSRNLELIESSLERLICELRSASKIPLAINLGIIERLHSILSSTASFSKPLLMENALIVLSLIANDFKGSQAIVGDESLLRVVLELMRTQKDLEGGCADIFYSLSAVPYVANKLPTYVSEELRSHMHVSTSERFFVALVNFIAREPRNFASTDILETLTDGLDFCPATAKCLALVLNCEEGAKIARSLQIEKRLAEFLLARDTHGDETKTYVVMALRNSLTNKELHRSDSPWRQLLAKLIDLCYAKANMFQLQQYCIQSLRIMSDVGIVREHLCECHRRELKEIPSLTLEAKRLKRDLLQWLDYRNYDKNDGNKYSKYFI